MTWQKEASHHPRKPDRKNKGVCHSFFDFFSVDHRMVELRREKNMKVKCGEHQNNEWEK